MTFRKLGHGTVAIALLTLAAVSMVDAAGARTTGNDEFVDPADEPCVLASADDVESALGIVDVDGVGTVRDLGTIGACLYEDSTGAFFQVANSFKTDGGRGVKELCAKAKADGRADYRKVTGVGKRACAFTSPVLGRPTPLMVLYALRKDSNKTGRTIELRVSGSDDALAAVAPQLGAGFATLGKKAAAFVKEEAID